MKTSTPWGPEAGVTASIYIKLFISKLLKLRVIQKFYKHLFLLSFHERNQLNLNIGIYLFKINTISYIKKKKNNSKTLIECPNVS